MVEIDEKSREIMRVLDETEHGCASTNEIRQKTGLNNRAVNYRWEILLDHNFVEIEYDASLTPPGVAPMKVGHLTEEGRRELAEGLAVSAQPENADTDARLDHLERRIDTLEQKQSRTQTELDGLIQYVNKNLVPVVAEAEDWMGISDGD